MTQPKSTRIRLIKRLDGYYKIEGFNALWIFVFSLYILFKNDIKEVVFLTYGIWFMVYILIQGTHYWRLKMLSLKGENFDQSYQIRLFKNFKRTNQVLCLGIPIVFAIQWYIYPDGMGTTSIFYWSLFTNAFAVAEHINYYHKQLSYDNLYDWQYLKRNKRLKVASLKKDLEEGKI